MVPTEEIDDNKDTSETGVQNLLAAEGVYVRKLPPGKESVTKVELRKLPPGKESVTKVELVSRMLAVAHQSPKAWRDLKGIESRNDFKCFVEEYLPSISINHNIWKSDKSTGEFGVQPLLANVLFRLESKENVKASTTKEEGSKPSADVQHDLTATIQANTTVSKQIHLNLLHLINALL